MPIFQKVAITNARFFSPIGFYEEERILGNAFFVDVIVEFPFVKTDTETLDHTLNYEELYALSARIMSPERKLLESAAEELMQALLSDYPYISSAKVSIRKVNPPFGGDAATSEVAMRYERRSVV